MSCRRIQPELGAYLDDELPEAAVEAIREHVVRCSKCEAELARLEKVHVAMRLWDAPKVSRDFQARLAERLGSESAMVAPREPVPVEVAARGRAGPTAHEREGLRGVARAAAQVQEGRFARLRRTTKWAWVAAATVLATIGIARWIDRPEDHRVQPRPDVSFGLVPASRAEAGDKIHFVLPARERDEAVAERPDPRVLLFLAAVRRALTGVEEGDRPVDEALQSEVALLEAEATGRPLDLGALQAGPGTEEAGGWHLPLLGTPALADDGARRDQDHADGLEAYRNGRFLEAARCFERLERNHIGADEGASALAHQVRALAAAGDFVRARELALRLHRDYPLRRKLAAALAARLDESEANQIVVRIKKANLAANPTAQARWELAVSQVAAWDLPGAEETLEKALGEASFAEDAPAASRAALLLVAVFNWMGEPRAARSVALRLAEEGTSPYREIGGVEAAFLDSLEGLDPAGLSGPDWRSVRSLVRFVRAAEALRRGDAATARAEADAIEVEDPDSRLQAWLRERLDGREE